eukprot:TRINITY_DN82370_c0_g1_i1.p1 TRINITY_DN82370_c0_g1~~TRINITY_DN82370_c0_g1_i1.p1  ORF type:complete len:480 (+),score=93.37 TRINITY_DN82370_c0_g1_i1:167-1441(+)
MEAFSSYALTRDAPAINVAACTHADPWVLILDSAGLDADFADVTRRANSCRHDCGISLDEATEGILTEELMQKVKRLEECMGAESSNTLKAIVRVLHNNPDDRQRIAAKKKVLFMLRKSACWDAASCANTICIAGEALLAGTQGRCPDGQHAFFDGWIAEYLMHRVPSQDTGELAKLQHSMASLMYDMKRVFIEAHCSRFQFGKHIGHNDASEERTSMTAMLHNMLRLPLSLPGAPSQVLYPRFAFRSLKHSDSVLEITKIAQRFVEGGTIEHQDLRTWKLGGIQHRAAEEEVLITTFAPLTLARLGQEIRDAMVDMRKRVDGNLPLGLLRPASMSYILSEEIVTKFVEQDVVLSTSFAKFQASHCTQSNSFFDADKASLPGGAVLRNVLRDSAILRMLEVCGYATLPDGFYETVRRDWTFLRM